MAAMEPTGAFAFGLFLPVSAGTGGGKGGGLDEGGSPGRTGHGRGLNLATVHDGGHFEVLPVTHTLQFDTSGLGRSFISPDDNLRMSPLHAPL